MTEPDSLGRFSSALAAVQGLLASFDDRGMVIGGVAASLLGKPRLTADVDVAILASTRDIPRLMRAARKHGLVPRLADAARFARQTRMLLLRHEASGIQVDLSLGMLPFEVEAVERSTVTTLGDVSVRIPTPEDLIILKSVAHRPQDLADIQTVAAAHADLDRERIWCWVNQFASALDLPGLPDEIARLIS